MALAPEGLWLLTGTESKRCLQAESAFEASEFGKGSVDGQRRHARSPSFRCAAISINIRSSGERIRAFAQPMPLGLARLSVHRTGER